MQSTNNLIQTFHNLMQNIILLLNLLVKRYIINILSLNILFFINYCLYEAL